MTVQARILNGSLLAGAGPLEWREGSGQHVFVRLYDEYFTRVYNYARYRCGDAETADDLAAQTFERAFSRLEQYDPQRGPFGAWLFAIVRNLVNDHLRLAQQSVCLPLEKLEGHPAPTRTPEETLIQVEAQAELLAALAHLNERERDLLSLKFAACLTNRRIAELTGLSEANVGVIVYRALHHLRVILASTEL
jgi:RNA polymerase sigma-70 factor (ECF subfamily)